MSASASAKRAGDRVGAGEVGGVVAPDRPPSGQRRAHRQHRVRRVAGEDVGAAGAVGVEQPAPVGVAALELFGVARVVGDDRRVAVLLPPAEGGHVVVVAMEEPGLAGAGLRGPVGLPALEPVRPAPQPAAQVGGVAVGDRPAQDVVGEAVDLEEDDPRHIGVDRGRCAGAPDGATTLRYQVSSSSIASSAVEDRGHGADPDRDHDPLEDAVDLGAGDQVDREGHQEPVEQQRDAAEGEDGERQRDPGQHRPDQGIEDADRRRRPSAAQPSSRVKPGSTAASRIRAASSTRTSRPRQTIFAPITSPRASLAARTTRLRRLLAPRSSHHLALIVEPSPEPGRQRA